MKVMKTSSKKKFVKWALISILSVILFVLAHKLATAERTYNAIGGEMFMLLIPFFVWYIQDCVKFFKEDENENQKNRR